MMSKKRADSGIFYFLIIMMAVYSCQSAPRNRVKESKDQETQISLPESPKEEDFTVTKEIYDKTFEDVESVILKVTKIIKSSDFKGWLPYLTQEYIKEYSDPEKLNEISDAPFLKKSNIQLKSLQDYFRNVVVPSRSAAKLDEIAFVDNNHIKAYMYIGEKKIILYYMEKDNGSWKITIW